RSSNDELFVAVHESGFGTSRKYRHVRPMSAVGGNSDVVARGVGTLVASDSFLPAAKGANSHCVKIPPPPKAAAARPRPRRADGPPRNAPDHLRCKVRKRRSPPDFRRVGV